MWKLKRWKRKLKKIRKKKNLSDKEINKMLKLYTKINLYEIEQIRIFSNNLEFLKILFHLYQRLVKYSLL